MSKTNRVGRNLLTFTGLLLLIASPNAVAQIDTDPTNDTIADVLPIAPATALANNAQLVSGTNGDVDFFTVPVTAGEIVIGMVTPISGLPSNFGVPDTQVITFQNSTLLTIDDDDDAGTTFPMARNLGSLFRVQVPLTGMITVGVSGTEDDNFDGNHTEVGSYILTVGRIDPSTVGGNFSDTDTTNDTRAGADLITLGPTRAAIAVAELSISGSDVDFFRLELKAGDVLSAMTAPVQSLPSDFNTPNTRLALFDFDGNIILGTNNDNAGAGTGAEFDDAGSDNPGSVDVFGSGLRALIVSDGTYYLGVTGFNDIDFDGNDDFFPSETHDETGRYALLVSIPEPTFASLICAGLVWMLCIQRRRNRFR